MRALRLLRRRPLAMLGLGALCAIGTAASVCLVGLPLAMGALVALLSTVLWAAAPPSQGDTGYAYYRPGWWTAALSMLGGALALVLAAATGSAMARTLAFWALPGAVEPAQWAGVALGPIVLAVCVAPVAFVPLAAIDGSQGLGASLMRSAQIASRAGWRRMVRTVVAAVVLVELPVLWFALGDLLGASLGLRIACGLGIASVAIPWSQSVVAIELVDHRDPATVVEAPLPRLPAAARAMLLGTVALGLVLAGLLVTAAVSPLPLAREWLDPTGFDGEPHSRSGDRTRPFPPVRLGDTDVTVRGVVGGIAVEAADGGGAGAIRTPDGETPTELWIIRPDRQHHAYRLRIRTTRNRYAFVEVDRRGVRLHDSIEDRLEARLGWPGRAGLLAAGILLILLLWKVTLPLAAARHLEAPDVLRGDPEAGPTGARLRALEGRLRLGTAAHLWDVGRRVMRAEGDAWIEAESGAIRIRLPQGRIRAYGAAPHPGSEVPDGATFTVLARFEQIALATERSAEMEWPAGGMLVPGGKDGAATAIAALAGRAAASLAPLLLFSLFATSLVLGLSL